MGLGGAFVSKMVDPVPDRREHVGDDPTMTAPPEDLGAHHGDPNCVRDHQQLEQPVGKLLTRHMIGVSAKRRVSPGTVRRIRTRPATAAECGNPLICDSVFEERLAQGRCVELRQTTRPGQSAHVEDCLDLVRPEHVDELVARPRRVANRPDLHLSAIRQVWSRGRNGLRHRALAVYDCALSLGAG